MSLPVLLLTILLLTVAFAVLLQRFALRSLVCTRTFSAPAFFEGDEGEMIEVVRNDRPFLIPWLRVESRVSPYIRLGRQENLYVSDETHYCSLFTLMPYQQIRRRHRVKFLHRGEYDLGSASLTAGDLLSFQEAHREQAMHVPVLVYPRLLEEGELPAPLERLMNEAVARRQLLTDPFLFRGIRPYQFGDPVRDIHWPATARTQEVQIRLHDYSAQTRMLVVLNCELKDGQWGDRLMEEEQDAVEYGISMAATLCMKALERGMSAGFAANMPIGDAQDCALLPPQGDAASGERLLCAFARLRTRRVLRFSTFLYTLCDLTGLDIILLSCYDSEEIREAMQHLRQSGNQVSLHLIQGGRP